MKIRLALTALGLALAIGAPAQAQTPQESPFGAPTPAPAVAGLDGRWEGAIETPEGPLSGVFRIATTGDKTTTLMDSPMQDVTGIPAIAKREGDSIVIDVPAVGGDFTGKLSADGASIEGAWRQNGMNFPLVVARK